MVITLRMRPMLPNIRVTSPGDSIVVAFVRLARNDHRATSLRLAFGLRPSPEMVGMTDDRNVGTARANTAAASRQERLRFSDFSFERTRAGKVSCRVTLEFGVSEFSSGTIEGHTSPAGDIRLGAEAAIRALEMFTEGRLTFELIGVKIVRAFDANIVITSLIQHGDDGPERLLGCYLAEADHVRGAALSVLNATNRVLGNFILAR